MRFVYAFFALALALSFMMAGTAVAAELNRNHTGGRFEMDIGGHNVGFLEPVEGAPATGEKTTERPVAAPISPQANVPPPRALGTLKPPCTATATVPKTGTGLGAKNKDAEPADKPQTVSDTANDPKN